MGQAERAQKIAPLQASRKVIYLTVKSKLISNEDT
jgi:hypothetical protein